MDDDQKIASIRAELPVTTRYIYMNTGTNGPLPRRTHNAMVAYSQRELDMGRIGQDAFTALLGGLKRAREAVAATLDCPVSDVALTHNTTEGINIALMGIDWRAGDEVITASTEHAGVLYPVYLLHQRYGVRIRMTDIGKPGVNPLDALRRTLSARTRAVALSHVCWSSGVTLPIVELAELAHRAGALLICDAAQSCGMLSSRVRDLGVDAYACSGQKWLCGPDGTGALYVRPDRLGEIQSTFAGYHTVRPGMSDFDGNFVPVAGAERYEVATINPASAAGLTASLTWLADDVGWDWAHARIARLGRLLHDRLSHIEGVHVLTPRETMAGLLHFAIAAAPPADAVKSLAADNMLLRATPAPELVRASIGFFNTEEEIERLTLAVAALASGRSLETSDTGASVQN
jgi:L-cysteine/cystine lyase